MKLLRNFLRARLMGRNAHSSHDDAQRRQWHVTVPAPLNAADDSPVAA